MTTMSERPLVSVVWHDAHTETTGWSELSDIDDAPCVVHTVGLLLANAKQDHVVIAQSITSSDALDGVLCIPIGMVKSMVVLAPMSKSTSGRAFR